MVDRDVLYRSLLVLPHCCMQGLSGAADSKTLTTVEYLSQTTGRKR
jgi:hypothetical protein